MFPQLSAITDGSNNNVAVLCCVGPLWNIFSFLHRRSLTDRGGLELVPCSLVFP